MTAAVTPATAERGDAPVGAGDRRTRVSQVVIAITLYAISLALPLAQAPGLWPVTAVGAVITGLLLWGALRDEAVAGPVVGLVLTATVAMFIGDAPAVGAIASVVVAIALGEHLAATQHARYATPGHAARTLRAAPIGLHAAVAAAASLVTLGGTLLPGARFWSAGAVGALAVVAFAAQRRRAALAGAPLPPPEQVV